MPRERVNGHTSVWEWTEVELSRGKISVRAIPPHLSSAAMAAVPLPRPPLVTIKSQVPGGGQEQRENPDDPQYKRDFEDAVRKRGELLTVFQYSWGVEAAIPDDTTWKDDVSDFIPNIKWAEGKHGYKADYIRYVLLQMPDDFAKVQRALAGETPITPAEVAAVEDSFRDQM